jgi:hypothetical protein
MLYITVIITTISVAAVMIQFDKQGTESRSLIPCARTKAFQSDTEY